MPNPSLRIPMLCMLVLAAGAAAQAPATRPAGPAIGLDVKKFDGGAVEIVDGDKPVLRYNHAIVPEPEAVKARVTPENVKYAVPRCDYIHPLYGLHGEVLTDDWQPDHPHHRGIYWAWPEVDWQGKRGDLHALQSVFARPVGQVKVERGEGFVEIQAENQWKWEDRTPIVREQAFIRANARTEIGRAIDLRFRCEAIDQDVQVARRETKFYGGLNVRLSPVENQEIAPSTAPPEARPRRAWAQRTGTLAGKPVALVILQHPKNPDYPGEWVQYPNLFWIQPTFPGAGTRHTISKDKPLELRFRLWICERKQDEKELQALWDDYAKR